MIKLVKLNTAPPWNHQSMRHIPAIWRSHWRRRRFIEDSR